MVRGYARRRLRTSPDRDVYAVAEAVVASAIWLAFVWLVLYALGDLLSDWGVLPYRADVFEQHRVETVATGLAVVLIPYAVGAGAAVFADWVGAAAKKEDGSKSIAYRLRRLARRLGLLRPAAVWDHAWSTFQRRGAGEVVIRMRGGSLIRGGWTRGARVDLSPAPRQIYLTSGYELVDTQVIEGPTGAGAEEFKTRREEATDGTEGVFIDGAEIVAVFFKEASNAEDNGAERNDEPDDGVRGSARAARSSDGKGNSPKGPSRVRDEEAADG